MGIKDTIFKSKAPLGVKIVSWFLLIVGVGFVIYSIFLNNVFSTILIALIGILAVLDSFWLFRLSKIGFWVTVILSALDLVIKLSDVYRGADYISYVTGISIALDGVIVIYLYNKRALFGI